MSKSIFFTGQPIFSQVLSFLPKNTINQIARKHNGDRYCKYYTTYDHLVSMLYAIFNQCTSIRELTSGLLAWEQRITHLGVNNFPRRSTFSDANQRRSEVIFGEIYQSLYKRYAHFLSDSRKGRKGKLYIADSTTVSLFQEILRGVGTNPANGKRKGGVKVHTLIRSDQDVPCLIRLTAAVAADSPFLKQIQLPKGSILVFDKGYNDYSQFERFTTDKITWVTRKRKYSVYRIKENLEVSTNQIKRGVQKDRLIVMGYHGGKKHTFVKARLINYVDKPSGKKFQFLTNNTSLAPATIAAIYQKRWQIELLFKRLKQNYPLRYFLGDSPNAIKIQIWCSLIADFLIKIIKSLAGKKWSFSNLASVIRIHLMTYINLYNFLRNPEKALKEKLEINQPQWPLFPT
jgi:Transposase DDE domain/Domain of unknown function (DUF4372)